MQFPDITPLLNQVHMQLSLLTVGELGFAVAVPILALLLRVRIKAAFKRQKQITLGNGFLRFMAPLISPILAILISLLGIASFRMFEADSLLLLFTLKLSIAWLAVRLIYMMGSQQTAGWLIALVVAPITLLQLFDVWDLTVETLSSITFSLGSTKLSAFLVLKGAVVILVMQWLASTSVGLVDTRLRRIKSMRASNRTLIIKLFQIILYCLIILFGMQMLGINLSVLGVVGGAVGVGIGFGLQKIASNFISGIILLFEKSIEIGDLIEFADGTMGFVRHTYARYTLIESFDGREIMVPNEEFISQRVISWTHSTSKARVEINVQVSYDDDLALARQLMLDAALRHPRALSNMPPECFVTEFADSGINLLLFFWVGDVRDGRFGPKSDVMLDIFARFKEHNITIPYPQRVLHMQPAAINNPGEPA